MKKLFIDKRTLKSGKKSFLNVSSTLDLFKYIKSVGGGSSIEFVQETYNSLLSKVNAGTLVPGTYYIITDYQTCYDRPDYDQFKNSISPSISSYVTTSVDPIIVFATSASTLAPEAYQPSFPNDTIKYDISYSTTESANPAFGRITERVDEFGNRADYDHRTIQFKRYLFYTYNKENPITGTVELLSDGTVLGSGTTFLSTFATNDIIAIPNSNEVFYQITNITDDFTMTVTGNQITATGGGGYSVFFASSSSSFDSYYPNNIDLSSKLHYTFDASYSGDGCYNTYIGDHAKYFINEGYGDFLLANNVFKDGQYENNTIGDSSYNNTFNDDCTANRIGFGFRNNITDDDFDSNVIGNFFENNIIIANFQYNQIGINFKDNIIYSGSFYRNQIGNDFRDNWLDGSAGSDFQNNQIGNQFNNNIIFRDFYKNFILNGYNNNQHWRECFGNKIGNGMNANEIYSDFYDNIISEYFINNTIGNSSFFPTYAFQGNNIGKNFQSNIILGNTVSNVIGNDFFNNNILDQFVYNEIGTSFTGNNIGNSFGYNKIGSFFQSNLVSDFFGYGGSTGRGNIIGNYFQFNGVGEYFYDNIILDQFNNNNVGEYFINNKIDEGFSNNTTGNEFKYNDVKAPGLSGVDFTINENNITSFTYNNPSGLDGSYVALPTSGSVSGFGALFNVDVVGGVVSLVTLNVQGQLYQVGETLTIDGTLIGGSSGVDDVIINVTGTSGQPIVHLGLSSTIFLDNSFNEQLYYIDNLGTLTVIGITD